MNRSSRSLRETGAGGPSRRDFVRTVAGAAAALPFFGLRPTGAFAATEDELAAAAKKEGSATFYSVIPQNVIQELIDKFQSRYGVRIDYQRLTSGALGQRYAAEADTNNVVADALLMTDKFFMDAGAAKGWFADISQAPAAAAFPQKFLTKTYATVALLPHGLAWNTRLVGTAPTSWQALTDPKWKRRVVLADPRSSFFSSVFYYVLREANPPGFLEALAAQGTFVNSAVQGVQQVAAGAAAFCAPAFPNLLPPLTKSGAPLGLAMLEPIIAADNLAAISAKAPHPNAARLLMSYILTAEGQELINRDTSSPLGTFPGTYPLPKLTDFDPHVVQAAQPAIFAALDIK